MENALAPQEIRRLCDAATWEIDESAGDTRELEALIARARRVADSLDGEISLPQASAPVV